MNIKEILVLHHSHFDIGFTHSQPVLWELQREFLDAALDLLMETQDWPEVSQPRWTVEATGQALTDREGHNAVPYTEKYNQGAVFRHTDRSPAAEFPEKWLRSKNASVFPQCSPIQLHWPMQNNFAASFIQLNT